MLDSEVLRLFRETARLGSFTAAAGELNYTQSAVSRRIASLEHETGGPLFERLARGVRLTPAGEALLRHAEVVLANLETAQAELRAIHAGRGGRLRVGSFPTGNAVLVPAALRAFHAQNPAVEVTLTEDSSRRLVGRLKEGTLDIAVVSELAAPPDADQAVRLRTLCQDEYAIGLSQEHRLAGTARIDLADLAEETWIVWGEAPRLHAACAQAGFTPRIGMRVTQWTSKLGLVATGLGVTLLPSLATAATRQDIALRPLQNPTITRTIYAALPAGAARLPAAEEFLAMLEKAGLSNI